MPTIFKNQDLKFTENATAIDNFRIQTATPRLWQEAKSEHIAFDIRLLNPDQYSFPYHFHRHAEELMYIISGSVTLRTPEGLQILNQGDTVFFEMGESGTHQFYNHTDTPCTFIDIRTTLANDVCEYPDSNKIAISSNPEYYDRSTQVSSYFKGEEKVKEIWNDLKNKQVNFEI
jgi:uncharacterized cupin superfamily protein